MVTEALAKAFNALLCIEPGHFGHARRASEPTPANRRAAARLSAIRAKNKSIPMEEVETRQVRRAEDRFAKKRRLSDLKEWMRGHRQNGAALTRLPVTEEQF